jgi:hypothetical protein
MLIFPVEQLCRQHANRKRFVTCIDNCHEFNGLG